MFINKTIVLKTFKRIDLVGQLVLILGFAITTLTINQDAFLLGYFIVGAWQGLSMVMHVANGWHVRNGSPRSIYHIITVVTIILALLALVLPFMFIFFIVLLFLAPIMAISYAVICYRETIYYTKRPLELI